MTDFRRTRFSPARSTWVAGLLALTLGLTGVLAYQAISATVSHERIAIQTMREHAVAAAWELSSRLREALYDQYLAPGLEVVAKSGGADPEKPLYQPPPPRKVVGFPEFHTSWHPEFFFRLDLATGSLVFSGTVDLSQEAKAWLRDLLKEEGRRPKEDEKGFRGMVLHGTGENTRVLALRVYPEPGPEAETVYGFQTTLEPVRALLSTIEAESALLPPALLKGISPRKLVSFVIMDRTGGEIFATTPFFKSEYKAAEPLGPFFGGMIAAVSLHPDAADILVIGGLPRSRLPVILGLLVLTVGLVLTAIFQIRREQELSRLRADFVSSVSHQLRTPLAQIRMFGETLLLGRVRSEEERQRSLEIIVKESRRLTHQVDNVLLFSRAQRKDVRLTPIDTELAPLIREVLESFCPLAEAQDCRVEASLEEGLFARVDAVAFSQILLNLLENALKYGPRDQIVDVKLTEAPRGGVRISVEDEGKGIPREERETVFSPYARLGRDRDSAIAGSGIGLAVVRELVQLQQGTVRVEGAASGGARFVIEFPRSHTDSGG